jgi:hypothetical protein
MPARLEKLHRLGTGRESVSVPGCRREGTDRVRSRYRADSKEHSMDNTKDPKQKQPGEKPEGKYHYNPGNMSGKEAEEESREEAHEREQLHERRDQKG